MEELQRRIAQAIDDSFMANFYDTTSQNVAPAEPFTLDKLQRMIASMPPRETWLSSRVFPIDKAITVEGSGERFTVAHPGFWLRLDHAVRDHPAVNPWSGNCLGFNIEPIEIDPDPEDTDERAARKKEHWSRLNEAFKVAMMPLPAWLRSPPKFGRHG